MKQSDIEKYDDRFNEELDKLDFNIQKVDRLCEQAAFKVAPLFQMYGITYGDRVPGIYYLAFSIKELLMDMLKAQGEAGTSSGLFRLRYDPDDDMEQIVIGFDLATIDRKDLR